MRGGRKASALAFCPRALYNKIITPDCAAGTAKASQKRGTTHESIVHRRHGGHQHSRRRSGAGRGWKLTLLNRGTNAAARPGARVLTADIHDEAAVKAALGDERFDVAVDFIAFTEEDVQRDVRLFAGRAAQYIFISSASAYQKPVAALPITESTPLANPYWQYSRDKIACENFLMERYREEGFPVTIVRPSHTYCGGKAVVALHGARGCWQTLARIRAGKPVIIPGDGTSLWTATHADDFAVGFVGLMGNPHALGTAVHITTDEGMTWNQIYAVLASAMGAPLCAAYVASKFLAVCGRAAGYDFEGPLLGDKAANVRFDNTKIKRLVLDFAPRVSMAQGIRGAVEYLLAHPELQTPDPEFDTWCDRVLAAQSAAKAVFDGAHLA